MDTVVQDPQIVQMSIGSVIAIAISIVSALAATVALLFRMNEKKNDAIIELTKSFIHTTSDFNVSLKNNTTSLENNTRVMEKLPQEIAIHVRLNSKKP